ncbi:PilW family protein, partial [Psychrobacter cibarius]
MIEQNQTSHHQLNRYPAAVSGFTLIELMISLVLGLLISAAVMQVYLINTRTITVQQSASEVQDSTIFAMQALEDHIRITNLGNPITSINDKTNHGGVVLTKSNLGSGNTTDVKYFTASTGSTDWT